MDKPSSINQEMLNARMMRSATWLITPDGDPGGASVPSAADSRRDAVIVYSPEADSDEFIVLQAAEPAPMPLPGFFVDFTGCEELLEEFRVAAESAGLSPSDSALDLIYLFANGELRLKV